MVKKAPLLFIVMLFVLVSMSCTNPITMYLTTQTALMQTATAAMWTPTPTYTPTDTPTNTPTDTPTYTPTPEYLYYEDFEDEGSGWNVSETTSALREYYDGGYRIQIYDPEIFGWSLIPDGDSYTDIRIEVEATVLGGDEDGDFGVMCRYQDKNNFYAMEVTSSGYALIYKFEYGDYYPLSSDKWAEVDGVNPDDMNKIVGICNGEDLELYVNDELVASASDSSFSDGEVAIVAGSLADVLFDNLFVFPL
jgi:hypothetical protein